MAPTPPPEPSLSNIALSLVRPPTLVMGIQYGLGWGHDNNQWTRIACLYDSIRPPRARPASIPIARYPRLLHFFKATILLSYIPHIQTTLKPSDSLYHSFFYLIPTLHLTSSESSVIHLSILVTPHILPHPFHEYCHFLTLKQLFTFSATTTHALLTITDPSTHRLRRAGRGRVVTGDAVHQERESTWAGCHTQGQTGDLGAGYSKILGLGNTEDLETEDGWLVNFRIVHNIHITFESKYYQFKAKIPTNKLDDSPYPWQDKRPSSGCEQQFGMPLLVD